MGDDERDRRERLSSGRRDTDPPGVTLREYLETLIRGVQIRVDSELGDLGGKVDELSRQCHKLRGEVHALVQSEKRREGREQATSDSASGVRIWVQWIPSLIASITAVAAVIIAVAVR